MCIAVSVHGDYRYWEEKRTIDQNLVSKLRIRGTNLCCPWRVAYSGIGAKSGPFLPCSWKDPTAVEGTNKNCAVLGYYAASCSNSLPKFRDKMGPIDCPETSIINDHYSLCNNPEKRSSHLRRGGSLKSRIIMKFYIA
jgi:hypothetical protein